MSDLVKIKRSDLYQKVWSEPISHIAETYSVHEKSIVNACNNYNIPRPEKNYWSVNERNRKPIIPLPAAENETIILYKRKRRYRVNDSTFTPKANISCILRILELNTDANKEISTNGIIDAVFKAYRLKIDRRTVYSAIKILQDLGYNIASENYKYRLFLSNLSIIPDRTFEPDEIQALLDSIKLNPMLPIDEERALYFKTKRLMPKHNCAALHNVVTEVSKKEIPSIFYGNIYEINIALVNDKKISFTYMKYDSYGKLVKKFDSIFILSPVRYQTIDLVTHLICADDNKKLYQFRIDRMAELEALEEKRIDVHKLTSGITDMDSNEYLEKIHTFKILCDADIATEAVDYFGTKSRLTDNGDDTFTLVNTAKFNKILIFALRFADKCEVSEPQEVRNSVIEKIKNNKYGI